MKNVSTKSALFENLEEKLNLFYDKDKRIQKVVKEKVDFVGSVCEMKDFSIVFIIQNSLKENLSQSDLATLVDAYVEIPPEGELEVDSRYYNYLSASIPPRSDFSVIKEGMETLVLRIEPQKFVDIRNRLPSLSEQKEIADYLDELVSYFDYLIDGNSDYSDHNVYWNNVVL